jgi:hypothetical protein
MDKRALKILFDTFWSPSGWKTKSQQKISNEDFEYAKTKGVMFDPVILDHDQAIESLLGNVKNLNRRIVADAFLASLSTRRLEWRSALGSYSVFQHFQTHDYEARNKNCNICGIYLNDDLQDVNVINFERFKWGGVRHNQVVYAAMDTDLFLKDGFPKPTTEDIQIFREIIVTILNAPASISSAKLNSVFPKSFKANKAERDIFVAILGYCGILGTPDHPGFSEYFIPAAERTLPDRHFVDMPYPACWWNGGVGINQARLKEYFGHVL